MPRQARLDSPGTLHHVILRGIEKKDIVDDKILGQDEFVERIIGETDKRIKGQLSINERKINANKKILEVCKKEGVHIEELRGGSRRGRLSEVRVQLSMELVKNYGLTLAETACQLGVSTSAISKIFVRNK